MKRVVLLALVPLLLSVHATPQAAALQPELALLVTRGLAGESSLHFVTDGELGPAAATFSHLPDAMVRGALLPGTRTVIATADRTWVRDHSFDATLLRLEPGREAVNLCDRVDHAARPLVSSDGRVFVGRGRAGVARDGVLRVDALTVDEIDARSGAARTVFALQGHHASPVAVHGDQLYVYAVAPEGASLRAVPLAGGRDRLVAELLPFARDFSLDGDTLVFTTRDEQRSDLWVIDAIDLHNGARRRLHRSASTHLAPHVWPGGEVAFDDGRGLTLLGAGRKAPLGAGVDVVRAVSADARWAAVWHYAPRALLPSVAVVSSGGAAVRTLASDDRTRLEIVGFVAGAR
jgi:hypothetical protein